MKRRGSRISSDLLFLSSCLLIAFHRTVEARFGPCDEQFRELNLAVCYEYIKMAAESPDMYWFGSTFRSRCEGDTNPRSSFCFNPVPPGAPRFSFKSLGSRLFIDDNFQSARYLRQLNNSIEVKYDSWPGWIEGCDSSQFSPMRYIFDVNPNMVPARAFSVRNRPQVVVDGCNDFTPCTLVLYDAAMGTLHNIWPNWPRTNRNLPGYESPQNPNTHPNTYVWLAYRQTKPLPREIMGSHLPYAFSLKEFAEEYMLQGPIAMTYMLVGGDISAISQMEKNGIYSRGSCANMLENELKYGNLEMISERLEILSDIDETIADNKLKYFLAAKFADVAGTRVKVDALNNGILPSRYAERAPDLSISPRVFGKPSPADIRGRNFTIIMMQPDISSGSFSRGQTGKAYIHWMITNVPDGVITRGNRNLPYQKPTVSRNPFSSQIYILLYEQSRLVRDPMPLYSRSCKLGATKRCQFPLKRFVVESGLSLTALTRFKIHVSPLPN